MISHKFLDGVRHEVQHFIRHAGIDAYPERIVHDEIGVFQFTDHTETFTGTAHFIESGMLQQITGKQVAGLYLPSLQLSHPFVACKRCIFFHVLQENDPTGTGVLRGFWQK